MPKQTTQREKDAKEKALVQRKKMMKKRLTHREKDAQKTAQRKLCPRSAHTEKKMPRKRYWYSRIIV